MSVQMYAFLLKITIKHLPGFIVNSFCAIKITFVNYFKNGLTYEYRRHRKIYRK